MERRSLGPSCARKTYDRNGRSDMVAAAVPRTVNARRFPVSANAEPGYFHNSGTYEKSSFTLSRPVVPRRRSNTRCRGRSTLFLGMQKERRATYSTIDTKFAESVNPCNGTSTAADVVKGFCLHLLETSAFSDSREDATPPAPSFCPSGSGEHPRLHRQDPPKSGPVPG